MKFIWYLYKFIEKAPPLFSESTTLHHFRCSQAEYDLLIVKLNTKHCKNLKMLFFMSKYNNFKII